MRKMVKKIISKKFISNLELKDKFEKEGETELNMFQRRTLDYLRNYAKDRNTEIIETQKIMELGDITEEEAIQILNIQPTSKEELKTIFYTRKTIVMDEFLNNILSVLKTTVETKDEKSEVETKDEKSE